MTELTSNLCMSCEFHVSKRFVDAAPAAVYATLLDEGRYLPAKWTYYHLYMIIDIYSRYVPGWLIADRERAARAERLVAETIGKHHIARSAHRARRPRYLVSMASKPVALPADLGVTKSHSRPRCTGDNPYSEAQFKSLKHRPEFPDHPHSPALCGSTMPDPVNSTNP